MRLGVVLPLFSGDPQRVLRAATDSEALGYHGVFVFDHFFPPGAAPDRPALEAFATLGAVAAVTERVEIGTLVTRLGLRPVGLVAKMAAWLDVASGGRMVLGVGTGDPTDRPEHDAYGIPMRDRAGRREHLEEALRALKALFHGERFEGGRLVPPLEGPLAPPPTRPGGPPVWVGAQADELVRLAGRLADGWNAWGVDLDTFEAKAGLLAESAGAAGRRADPTWAGIALVGEDRAETESLLERRRARGMEGKVWAGTAEDLVAFLDGLARAGATWAVLVLAGPADRRRLIAERVLPALDRGSVSG